MTQRLFTVLAILAIGSAPAMAQTDIETVAAWMSGSFSSAAQAEADPEFYHITLEMAPIWSAREGEYWLYVEQAVAATKDQPYRQRVYRLMELADGLVESAVYLLPDPEQAIGAWKLEEPLQDVSPDQLIPRTGCSVYLKRSGPDRFQGSTREAECSSELRGARYATSEVMVTADRLESWDRGYDAEGQQVWGAVKAPYVFRRE